MNDKPVIQITEPEVIEKENETIYDYDKSHVIYKMQDLGSFAELQKMKKQNQKYKEVIDKAINYIEWHSKFIFGKAERRFSDGKSECADGVEVFTGSPTKLLDILKEVE